MDLLTYAVSQKLRQNNDMWKYLAENQPVPQELIADAFASVIETYEDDEAVRLTSHYDDYLAHHVPVTFTPNGAGIQVNGEIDDMALEVMKFLHHKEDADIVEQTVRSITRTISPGRDAEITDIETFASELKRSVEENHKRVHQLRTASELLDDESASFTVHERIEDKVVEPPTPPLEKALADLEEAEREAVHRVDDFIFPVAPHSPEQSFMDALDEPTFELDDAPATDADLDVPTIEDEPVSETSDEEKTDAGVLASVWNGFVQDIRDSGLHERMDLQTPLALAKA